MYQPWKGGQQPPTFASYGQKQACVRINCGLHPMSIVICDTEMGTAAPYFSPHVYCGQMAGWIRIPLGTEVGLSSGDIVLDGDPGKDTYYQQQGCTVSIIVKRRRTCYYNTLRQTIL